MGPVQSDGAANVMTSTNMTTQITRRLKLHDQVYMRVKKRRAKLNSYDTKMSNQNVKVGESR